MNDITTHEALNEGREALGTNTVVSAALVIDDPSGLETLRITMPDGNRIDVNTAEQGGGETGDTELIWGEGDAHGTADDLARYVAGETKGKEAAPLLLPPDDDRVHLFRGADGSKVIFARGSLDDSRLWVYAAPGSEWVDAETLIANHPGVLPLTEVSLKTVYRLRWSVPVEHVELVNGDWEPTGADEATVVLESAPSPDASEDEWTPVEDRRGPSETLVIEPEDEAEDESLWRAAEDRLLARFDLDRSDITEVVTPW